MKRLLCFVLLLIVISMPVSGCGGGGEPEDTTGTENKPETGFSEIPVAGSSVIVITSPEYSPKNERMIRFEFLSVDELAACRLTTSEGEFLYMDGGHLRAHGKGSELVVEAGKIVRWQPTWAHDDLPMTESIAYITAVFEKEGVKTGFALIEIEDDGWSRAVAKMLYQCSFPENYGDSQEISDFYIERRVIELQEASSREREAEGKPEPQPIREFPVDVIANITAGVTDITHAGTEVMISFSADSDVECRLDGANMSFRDPLSPGYEASPVLINGGTVLCVIEDDPKGPLTVRSEYVTAVLYKDSDIVGFSVIEVLCRTLSDMVVSEPSAKVLYQCVFPRVEGERQPVTSEYVETRVGEIKKGSEPTYGGVIESEIDCFGRLESTPGRREVKFEFISIGDGVSCSVSTDSGYVVHYVAQDGSEFGEEVVDSVFREPQEDWEFAWRPGYEADLNGVARITAIYIKEKVPVGFSVIKLWKPKGEWHAKYVYSGVFPLTDGDFQHVTFDYIRRRADEISEDF